MARASIPVDLTNPGQVFACLGFLEAADMLLGDAQGGFDWRGAQTLFHLSAEGAADPVEAVLDFVAGADVRSVSPDADTLATDRWDVATDRQDPGAPFPFRLPASPATLPALLIGKDADGKEQRLTLDYWGDSSERDNVKFWAGAAGYPGAALARDAIALARKLDRAAAPLFDLSAVQSSSFRFDWRRDTIALDTGFAVNSHGDIAMAGYPIVEILAAIGVSHARPLRPERRNKLAYRYGVVASGSDELLDPVFLRAALGCAELPFPQRFFSMSLGWPGQENQARCITDVVEEPRR
jgi:CRISPR-associated protein Csx14